MNLGTVLQTRVGHRREIRRGNSARAVARPQDQSEPPDAVAPFEREMSDAASAFGALLAEAIEGCATEFVNNRGVAFCASF